GIAPEPRPPRRPAGGGARPRAAAGPAQAPRGGRGRGRRGPQLLGHGARRARRPRPRAHRRGGALLRRVGIRGVVAGRAHLRHRHGGPGVPPGVGGDPHDGGRAGRPRGPGLRRGRAHRPLAPAARRDVAARHALDARGSRLPAAPRGRGRAARAARRPGGRAALGHRGHGGAGARGGRPPGLRGGGARPGPRGGLRALRPAPRRPAPGRPELSAALAHGRGGALRDPRRVRRGPPGRRRARPARGARPLPAAGHGDRARAARGSRGHDVPGLWDAGPRGPRALPPVEQDRPGRRHLCARRGRGPLGRRV
ncbi:MAG: hypothetical protein AVDCRST_MAG13-804, partial [uncultured Solirubrobacteraceae bacterium]